MYDLLKLNFLASKSLRTALLDLSQRGVYAIIS